MEPFGILQFLQTLLTDTQKKSNETEQPSPTNVETKPSQERTQTDGERTETPPTTPPQMQDAILRYMEKHDAHAKKIKRS